MSEIKANKLSPATGVGLQLGDASDVITIPSNCTITNNGTANGFGGGKLLQVVQTVVTAATFSTTSSSFVDATGLTVTTGALATTGSKLLITVHATLAGSNSSSDPAGRLHVSAGTANPILGDAVGSRTQATSVMYSATNDHSNILSFSYLTPALGVTSAVTCKLEVRINNGATMYMNRQSSDADNSHSTRLTSSITAMEIGA